MIKADAAMGRFGNLGDTSNPADPYRVVDVPTLKRPARRPPRRCNTDTERRALMERAFLLGVPRNYGRVRHLRTLREPAHLTGIGTDIHGRAQWLQPRTARAFTRMRETALRDRVKLQVVSAFRSIEYQLEILERKLMRGQSMDQILKVSAAPGYSEHHSGRCVDFTTPGAPALEEVFENSAAFAWLMQNAGSFGFTLSYPRNNRHGITYEPWHWCWHAPGSCGH